MKSRFGGAPGNANLRGRRTKLLSCGCCEVQNFREREAERAAAREMASASTEDTREALRDAGVINIGAGTEGRPEVPGC